MARPGPQTQAKRQRENAKREKRRAKDERRAARKAASQAGKEPDAAVGAQPEPYDVSRAVVPDELSA